MKKILILGSIFCFLLISKSVMAQSQCSENSTSASCICYGYTNYSPQGQWTIESGVPVTVDVDFEVVEQGDFVGAEVDLGSDIMDYYNDTNVGEYLDTKVYPASDNDDGNLYLAIGVSGSESWGKISASW